MSKIILYSHGGSGNHGCEAIVRGTYKILNGKVDELYSYRKAEDIKYGLNELMTIKDHTSDYPRLSLKRITASLMIRLFHNDKYAEKMTYDALLKNVKKGDIALSIGGDNYCYNSYHEYAFLNNYLNNKGIKTVLWGCSVEPSLIDDKMKEDLKKYSLIIARESISYDALKKANDHVLIYPDPAFTMEIEEVNDFDEFFKINTVGINISPVVIQYAKEKDIVLSNVYDLINYIIENTNYNIALIPHVSWSFTDDSTVLSNIYEKYKNNSRVILIPEMNAKKLKYIISRCSLFIGARTHATIAAYSTCVPTLVIGYSVKAKGIAKDLFGTYENYVIPTQNLKNKDELKRAFIWLEKKQAEIRQHLNAFIPQYKRKTDDIFNEIQKLKDDENVQ